MARADAGVVDEHEDLAGRERDLRGKCVAGRGIGHVKRERGRQAPGGADARGRLLSGITPHVGGDHLRPVRRDTFGDGRAIALPGAGDQHHMALKQAHSAFAPLALTTFS